MARGKNSRQTGKARKEVREAAGDQDLSDLFAMMTGEKAVPPNVAYQKFNTLKTALTGMSTLLSNFCRGDFVKAHKDYEMPIAEIMAFCNRVDKEIAEKMKPPPFTETEVLINRIQPEVMLEFSDQYKAAKQMDCVRTCVLTCRNLVNYRANLTRKKDESQGGGAKLDPSFIRDIPGPEFTPFKEFSSLNLKEVYMSPHVKEVHRQYIVTLLAMVLEYTLTIQKVYSTADWDPEVFASVMMPNIMRLKKEIPRCDKAFKAIENSIDLLKVNMDDYYGDCISTGNPSVMLENYIMDVSQNTESDSETNRQFATIVREYRKKMEGQAKNPRAKEMFKKLQGYMNIGGEALEDADADSDDAGASA